MAEFDLKKEGYNLTIVGDYSNTLDMEGFSRMMKDPSYCYKFYWLEAIVQVVSRGVTETTFDEIINEMICNAWYSVREFHVHLSGLHADGIVKDSLEREVLRLSELSMRRQMHPRTKYVKPSASTIVIHNLMRRRNSLLTWCRTGRLRGSLRRRIRWLTGRAQSAWSRISR